MNNETWVLQTMKVMMSTAVFYVDSLWCARFSNSWRGISIWTQSMCRSYRKLWVNIMRYTRLLLTSISQALWTADKENKLLQTSVHYPKVLSISKAFCLRQPQEVILQCHISPVKWVESMSANCIHFMLTPKQRVALNFSRSFPLELSHHWHQKIFLDADRFPRIIRHSRNNKDNLFKRWQSWILNRVIHLLENWS